MNINRLVALICHPSLFVRSKTKLSANEKVIYQPELDHVLPTKQELKQRRRRYGVCLRCSTPLSDKSWCQICEGEKLQRKFFEWTSGNQHINTFIQSTQLRPSNKDSYLLWIPFDDLVQFKYVANGGFSAVYAALWDRSKTGRMVDVVLKRLHGGQISNPEFLKDQVSMFIYGASRKSAVIRCYGITQHPTEGYMLVMECGELGDIRTYLRVNHQDLLWSERIYLLRDVARALNLLHSREFVHGDLHTGNILKKSPKPSLLNRFGLADDHKRECVVDLPLCYSSKELFGVMPYVAPEVFNNGYHTKASDVYSFGLVMWEFAVGQTPYSDYAHDRDLMEDICRGVRPDIDETIPQFYVDLMRQCWSPEPLSRPSAQMIKGRIEGWVSAMNKTKIISSKEHQKIVSQIKNSDDMIKKNFRRQSKMPDLVTSTPTPVATTFFSQNLTNILTPYEHSSTSSSSSMRKSSTFSSNSHRHY